MARILIENLYSNEDSQLKNSEKILMILRGKDINISDIYKSLLTLIIKKMDDPQLWLYVLEILKVIKTSKNFGNMMNPLLVQLGKYFCQNRIGFLD